MKTAIYLIHVIFLIIFMDACSSETENIANADSTAVVLPGFDSLDATNYFYDNAENHVLAITELYIDGEVGNPGKVDFSKLEKHSVIVKETLLDGVGDKFTGAYRYDGYSLMDILNNVILKKKNEEEFHPIIDIYVEIENAGGDKVVLSWGEIFYPNNLHNVIIATDVMRIVPSKTKDLWPLPETCRLVVSSDLITERNIANPVKITVKSYDKSYPVDRNISPLLSKEIAITVNGVQKEIIKENPPGIQEETFQTIFYGRGRGIHSTEPFTGIMLKELMEPYCLLTKENICTGIFIIKALDGYRSVFSFSEVFNRNDQSEVLLIYDEEATDKGKFRVFPACDFFSDRAVKAIDAIIFERIDQPVHTGITEK